MRSAQSIIFLFSILLTVVVSADSGVVVRDTKLHAEPFRDARVVGSLSADTVVEVGKRRGGWYHVELADDGGKGWLRMTTIRIKRGSGERAKQRDDDSGGKVLNFLTTGRSGSSGVTAATGIRGLDAADVTDASPDRGAVDALDQFSSSSDAAQGFAGEAGIKGRKLEYLEGAESASQESDGSDSSDDPFSGWGSE